MASELGKVIVTMGHEAEQRGDQHCEEMHDILREILEQVDRREERHQSKL